MTTLTFESVTAAIKAKKLLQRMKIQARLIKVDATKSTNGCTHGLQIPSSLFYTVIKELIKDDIKYNVYEG